MNDRIQEIRERHAAVTPGKWYVQSGEHYYAVHSSQGSTLSVVANQIMPNDVMAIAHAPRDIAYLLSEVERLQKENKRLIGALEDVKIYVPASDTPAKDAVKIANTALSHLKG